MNLLTNMMMLAAKKGSSDDGFNVFENIRKFATGINSKLTGAAWAIFALAVVIAGVCWVIGGQTAQFAKSTLGRVIIGVALVALATALVGTIASVFGKSATGMSTINPAFTSNMLNHLAMLSH